MVVANLKAFSFLELDYDVDRTLISFVTEAQKERFYFKRLKVVKEALLQIEKFDEQLDDLNEEPKSRTTEDPEAGEVSP